MKCYLLLLFLWILDDASVLAIKSSENKQMRYGHLNILAEELKGLKWGNDETQCLKQLLSIIKNVQNSTLWATWIWDSMQPPVGQLYGSTNNYGNYDECLEFPWQKVYPEMRTQYCFADIHLTDVDYRHDEIDFFGDVKNYIRGKTKHHLQFNNLKWGVCTPAVCKPHSVTKFVGALFRQSHLGLAVDEPHISVSNCDVAGEIEVNHEFIFYFTWWLAGTTISLTFLATFYVNRKGFASTSTALMYAKAFYIPKNVKSLLGISDNDLRSIYGIRAINVVLVIYIHVFLLTKFFGISNAYRLDKDFEDRWVLAILNFEIIVDTFTYMSGILIIRSLMDNGLKPFNPVKVIVKRYLRLILPIIMVLLITYKSIHIQGGLTKNDFYDKELEACNQNWWAIVLMVQNYVNIENMCYPVLWSVACDFHLAVFATIGTWLYIRNRKLGLTIFSVGFIASIAVPATVAYFHPESALVPPDFRSLYNYREKLIGNLLYTPTHFRAGPYFVGMLVGYLVVMYKPHSYRNVISKKYSILAFAVFLAMFTGYVIVGYLIQVVDTNDFVLAAFASLKRIYWAVILTILIILCEYGTLPLVPEFLSWSAWAPFCRLSYGIYLIHIALISYWRITTRTMMEYDFFHLALLTLGVSWASCILSLCLWTFFEEPLRIIISIALKDRNKASEDKKEE